MQTLHAVSKWIKKPSNNASSSPAASENSSNVTHNSNNSNINKSSHPSSTGSATSNKKEPRAENSPSKHHADKKMTPKKLQQKVDKERASYKALCALATQKSVERESIMDIDEDDFLRPIQKAGTLVMSTLL